MPTAKLNIFNNQNIPVSCRAILDTGSTRNFITTEFANSLNLSKNIQKTQIGALNDLITTSEFSVTATIKSHYNKYEKTLRFLSVPSICDFTPDQFINRKTINIPQNIQLADSEFYKPAPVQLLLGAGTSLSLLSVGQIKLSSSPESELILQKTQLGWILGGSNSFDVSNNTTHIFQIKTRDDLARFWEIEEGPDVKYLSPEEVACETHFKNHHSRAPDGSYIVALPFNEKKDNLIGSHSAALKRLLSLEKRFGKNLQLKAQYTAVLNEYIQKGYLKKVAMNIDDGYFLPHQAVFKENSLTTKLRVVFDGSCATSTGVSLNDALLAGPTIQDDLFSLLIRFRCHLYVLTGDIEKMYLQVRIQEPDQKYLKILWRNEKGELSAYQFNRLVFGLKPASFLATRSIAQLAEDELSKFPEASPIIKRDLYVDDLLTGADSIEELIKLRKDICTLLSSGGFNLRQCASNSSQVLETIPNQIVNLHLQADNSTLKTLGVHWNSTEDKIIYTVNMTKYTRITKRIICSEIAKVFDPLGLLNPVIVLAKLLLQKIWKLQLDWDESLPIEIHSLWETLSEQLPLLNNISFDRMVVCDPKINLQLHGFCDASEKAYGACIYIRSSDSNNRVRNYIFCAKSKVAPIKTIQTIPRLELCAAVLLANLCSSVLKAIHFSINNIFLWSDSMVALQWIKSSPHTLKTFVANRVSDIQSKTNISQWNYVPTQDNPADMLSRGLTPFEFQRASNWISGPDWLALESCYWPKQPEFKMNDPMPEVRVQKCLNTNVFGNDLFERFSSFNKLRKIIAICLRFKTIKHTKGPLQVEELRKSNIKIVQLVQLVEFSTEFHALKAGHCLPSKSKLISLNPFLDGDGLIRVGGRLKHSHMAYQSKYPILLPKANHVTKLLIQHHHDITFHGGLQTTLYSLRQHYWVLDGRNQVKQVIRSCIRCNRVKPIKTNYKMGDLPAFRTLEVRPFTNVGIDYCGPFYIKEKKLRNRKKIKSYVAVFICLSTKAVHLELVSDLTTEAFLAALKRFVARRGLCSSILSDNATNFVGADRELRRTLIILNSENQDNYVKDYLLQNGISWKFSPPHSPHFGGIWEAAVKSFKHHLRRVVGNALFTFEQLSTIVIEIEAILNSRPLTPMSSDPNDFLALTPGHFLIGSPLTGLPEQNITNAVFAGVHAWKHLQKVKQDFWKRWHKEYLNEINMRRKWHKGEHNIKTNSLVLLQDDNVPPLRWRLGRVMEVFKGSDGIARTASLKTEKGVVTRAIKRLALLPVA